MNNSIIDLPIIVNMDVIENSNVFELDIVELSNVLNLSIDSEIIVKNYDAERYEGSYLIIPAAYDDQVLETKNKLCTENIVVEKVPLWETSNLSGGNTVYIAERL